jgi:predicted enzyme related to lactoylglutathione lyase
MNPPTVKALQGKFLWFELVSGDVETAKQFYGRLFGWEFRKVGPTQIQYHLISNRGTRIGGIVYDPDMQASAKAAQWIGFISIADPDRLATFVISEGGEVVIPPGRVGDLGRYLVFKDPQGALLGGLKSFSGAPPDELPLPGAWIWMELWATDPPKAAEFYKELAGYRVFQDTGSEQPDHYILVSSGVARATVIPILDDELSPFWLPYVRVENLSQALDRAKQAGGTLLIKPEPDIIEGKIAILADPTGGMFALLELTDETQPLQSGAMP